MQQLLKSDTSRAIVFLMVSSTDHVTPVTGITPTVTISKNGAAFASPAGTVAEVANGVYKLTPAAADVNTVGALVLHATGTGADPCDAFCQVGAVAQQVFDEDLGGHTTSNTFGEFLQPLRSATAQTGSTASTIVLDASASAVTDFYRGDEIYVLSGTGAGQQRTITAYNGTTKTATVNYDWATTPDNTSVFAIYANGELPTLDEAIEGYNLKQIMRGFIAVLLGKTSGAGTTVETFRNLADSKTVVTVTIASGNRSAITLDLT